VYLFKYFFVVRLVILVTRLQVTTLGYFKMLNERHAFEVISIGLRIKAPTPPTITPGFYGRVG
jgi:hypothetical protein